MVLKLLMHHDLYNVRKSRLRVLNYQHTNIYGGINKSEAGSYDVLCRT